MRVLIGNYVLIEGGIDELEDAEVSQEDAIQRIEPVRADYGRVVNRGNGFTTLQFQKTREHASFRAAERFWLMHLIEIPRTGTVSIIAEGPNGSDTLILRNATVHGRRGIRRGVSTIHNYTITGGELTTQTTD